MTLLKKQSVESGTHINEPNIKFLKTIVRKRITRIYWVRTSWLLSNAYLSKIRGNTEFQYHIHYRTKNAPELQALPHLKGKKYGI
jgi:hypothetical protein